MPSLSLWFSGKPTGAASLVPTSPTGLPPAESYRRLIDYLIDLVSFAGFSSHKEAFPRGVLEGQKKFVWAF